MEVGRHLNIQLLPNTEVLDLKGKPGNFKVRVKKHSRYVDLSKCTSCGECEKVCPVDVTDEYNLHLSTRKAIYKKYPQAIPGAYAIDKRGIAPCKATCPAHVSTQGYIALINQGKYREAIELFKQEHPFPGVCGRVCHHPCESECTRKDIDEPVNIRGLHRFLADIDLKRDDPYVPEIKERKKEKVAVIGSGPAGLSCAYFLALKGYKVVVFEKLPVPGGMMAVGIPKYRLPREILNKEISLIQKMGVEIRTSVTFGKDVTLDSLKEEGFDAVFLALGLHKSKRLNVPGENLKNIYLGIDFLKESALGREIKLNGKVVVIGGGNVAVDVSLVAKRLGAKEINMVCLEKRDEMPAWEYEIKQAEEEGIKIINSYGPKEFIGEETVKKIVFKRCTQVFNEDGEFNPKYDENDLLELEADAVIIAIGQTEDFSYLKDQGLDVDKGVIADPITLQTSINWVFAGGDCVYGPKSVVEAIKSGKEAAESIHRFINGLDLKAGRGEELSFVRPDTKGEKKIPRVRERVVPVDRRTGFEEIVLGYSEEEAKLEASRCLKCGVCSECYQCVKVCLPGAINHDEKTEIFDIDVGAVIVSVGVTSFDPHDLCDLYLYKEHPDVLTSLEFERILSPSGPTSGHLIRPSDRKEPQKIAWIQCVGSRNSNRCGNDYCSSVCCVYAIKQALVAKDHVKGDLEEVIFYMDIRTHGKDFERYYERAKEEGVRFVRARPHTLELGKNNKILIKYAEEGGSLKEEEFDMVILSIGLVPPKDAKLLADVLDFNLNEFEFARTSSLDVVKTTKDGVFVTGAFQAPKDIPQSVTEASTAACEASLLLSEARGTLARSKTYPEQRDVSKEEPKVGVFICSCGINISSVIDVNELIEFAKTLPHVEFVENDLFTCSVDTQSVIVKKIKDLKLNRIVIAACTPRTHESLFQETLKEAGLNEFLVEMANIRNQNSWVHQNNPKEATEKAKDQIRMAVAKVLKSRPLSKEKIKVCQKALIVGGGVAGIVSALTLAEMGFECFIVEKTNMLGGNAWNLDSTYDGKKIRPWLEENIKRVESHPKIEIFMNAILSDVKGAVGNFEGRVLVDGEEKVINFGAAIIATGAREYKPKEYLYGEDPRVLTHLEMERVLDIGFSDGLPDSVVFIQCVGSRDDERPYCSRLCCTHTMTQALKLKEFNPKMNVYVFYRDIRTYAFRETLFKKAREKGVIFIRYSKDKKPEVYKENGDLVVEAFDPISEVKVKIYADMICLATAIVPNREDKLIEMFKLSVGPDGFITEAHPKLRPVDSTTDGVFLAGLSHYPKPIEEAIAQAKASSMRASIILSKEYMELDAIKSFVTDFCDGCGLCVDVCPYDAIKLVEESSNGRIKRKAEVSSALCKGCGQCEATCPKGGIMVSGFTLDQIGSQLDSLLPN